MRNLSLRCAGFSLVVACGFSLSSCSAQTPGRVGSVVCGTQALSLRRENSVVVVRGLSCPTACGILVPQPGIKPASPALEGRFLPLGYQGNPPNIILNSKMLDVLLKTRTRQAYPILILLLNITLAVLANPVRPKA